MTQDTFNNAANESTAPDHVEIVTGPWCGSGIRDYRGKIFINPSEPDFVFRLINVEAQMTRDEGWLARLLFEKLRRLEQTKDGSRYERLQTCFYPGFNVSREWRVEDDNEAEIRRFRESFEAAAVTEEIHFKADKALAAAAVEALVREQKAREGNMKLDVAELAALLKTALQSQAPKPAQP